MNEMLLKFIENTPVLAVLAIYILYSLRAQGQRDKDISIERQQFMETYKQLASSVSKVTETLQQQNQALSDFMEMVTQAHQYQKMEHEQMVKILERLNGK